MDKLGIEPTLLIAQIVNFSIIVILLAKLLYKPIISMLDKRKKEIEEGLRLTEKMREEEEKMNQKREKQLDMTRKEAQQIIDEARKQAREEEKDIIDEAHATAETIIEKGKAEAQRLREEMEKDIRKTAVTLATAMTKRLLEGVVSGADKHKLIEKHIKELESVKA